MGSRQSRELLGLPREKGDPITFQDRNELLDLVYGLSYDLDMVYKKCEVLEDLVRDALRDEWLAKSREVKVVALNEWLAGDYGITVEMFTDEEWLELDSMPYLEFKGKAWSLYRDRSKKNE